ncbi:acetylornithine deacetylase [Roseovarius sp.]|uniref:acetylornithine deacetylase n=1 Tax=Roseovarius sp. TaxID=1486281 RepID=UPI002610951D|nr:acetylornithine deacetylase [Roseovarius sp.]MDM8164825.1 acetylornithine deacetylase [Roseovarius sp.]
MTVALDHLDRLVAFETVSSRSNLDLVDWVAQRLASAGARITRVSNEAGEKECLVATMGPAREGGLMLSAHSDVVPVDGEVWTSDPFRLRRDGGRVVARGAADMKGFLACSLAAMEQIDAAALKRPVHLALSYDEELGCTGTDDLVDVLREAIPLPGIAIVGEPTLLRIVSAHKGARVYETEFHGRSAHSSQSHRGVSSNVHAARFIAMLDRHFDRLGEVRTAVADLQPPQTTFNVGLMTGGWALNIIPDFTRLVWEFRNIPEVDADQVEAEILGWIAATGLPEMQAQWSGARIETRRTANVPALDPAMNRAARDEVHRRTGCKGDDAVPFGTEAGFFQGMGVPTVVCGPGSIDVAHKPDEYVEIAQIERAERMLGDMIAWTAD